MKRKLLTFILIMIFPCMIFSVYNNAGECAYTFLNIDASVKAGGMGGAFSSVTGHVESLSYNIAAVADLPSTAISFTYMNWGVEDSSLNSLQLAVPLLDKYVLGIQWKMMTFPTLHKYDEYGFYLRQTFTPSDNMGLISLSSYFGENIYWGVGIGTVKEIIASYLATAWFINLGIIYKMDYLSAGISLNYLPVIENPLNIEDMPLPMTVRIGVSYEAMDGLLIALDVEKVKYNSMMIHAGVQYTLMDMIDLRLGYKTGNFEGLTFGAGIEKMLLDNFTVGIDYAFGLISDNFNSLHRIGFTMGF